VVVLVIWFLPIPWLCYRGWRDLKHVRQGLLHGRNAIHAIVQAKIAPVLYLRSFAFDEAADRTNLIGFGPETALVQELWEWGAPVLAIGRPGEADPPAGALRFYVSNDRWQETIAALIPHCSLVIIATGHTKGLGWELHHIRTNLHPTKLLLWLSTSIDRKLKRAQRSSQWAQFTQTYRELFPVPLPSDASGMRFVAFDINWTPIPIPSETYPVSLWDRANLWVTGSSIAGLRSFLRAVFP